MIGRQIMSESDEKKPHSREMIVPLDEKIKKQLTDEEYNNLKKTLIKICEDLI